MKTGFVVAIVLIGTLIIFALWLISIQIEDFELQKDPKLHELKGMLKPMFDSPFNGPLLSQNSKTNSVLDKIGLYKGEKSYTINKSKIFLCLRDANGEYYSNNTLIFVLLHEIAHVLCVEEHHTPLFQEILDELIHKAVQYDLYDPSNPVEDNYCE